MRLRIAAFSAVFFCTLTCFAQKTSLSPEGSISAGLLEGEKGNAFHVNVTAGVKSKTWTASAGTGLDYYGVRSIPLYLQLAKRIFNRAQTPFVYANGGYHFPWVNTDYKEVWSEVKTVGGLYWNGGLGYQFPALRKAALFFSAGYSFKEYAEVLTTYYQFCPGGDCPPSEQKSTTHRYLRRLSLTTGLRF